MKKDFLIPISCLIIIIISSILLYIDFTKKIDYSGSEQIGTITFKKRIAERKYAGEVIWETIDKSAPIYNYDSLKTSESSLSVIKFKDNTEVELGENTFILLTWSEDEGAKINFTKGSISARAKTKDSKINIISDGAKIKVDQGDIEISKNENEKKIELNVTSGSAVVETSKGAEEIK